MSGACLFFYIFVTRDCNSEPRIFGVRIVALNAYLGIDSTTARLSHEATIKNENLKTARLSEAKESSRWKQLR
jgi:hypothetical protein